MKKTLFITGGSRGIGRGIALVFAQNDYDVAFTIIQRGCRGLSLKKEIEQLGQKGLLPAGFSLKKKELRIRPHPGRQRHWERFPMVRMQD